ncbi:DUF3772 domain-containing protein [Paracoccus alkenifer]|uniref:Small-conductance mechanosensitive channel n=1 Tax=Paracoccus alkenifer TaxID=65735 RepID=A0A1H6LRU2_9RHOB|nr:DUF3772 domain-containing protein [Paracoccus alkenifer]SEH91416.1 Small-conductance mechanosensitive channel [Paracoccus alkenifer]
MVPVRKPTGDPAAAALRAMFAALVLWLALAVAGLAQSASVEPDYGDWEQSASRAEELVEASDTPPDVMGTLRADIVGWRDQFQQAQSLNGSRIATLREQIGALGPAPAEGESEAEDIAARRRTLTEQLSELQAPGLRAIEAYSRADSLVRRIDDEMRTRQTNALLRHSASPLLPGSWAQAVGAGVQVVRGMGGDLRERWAGPSGETLPSRLPVVALYLALALGLLVFARGWVDALPRRLSERASDYAREAVGFVASLGQIAIPTAGAHLLVLALDATDLAGPWARPILMALPVAALILFGGRWLAQRFFPATGDPPVCFPEPMRLQGRLYGTGLAVALALHHVAAQALLPLSGLRGDGPQHSRIPLEIEPGAAAVWHLPILILGAVMLFRLGRILRRAREYTNTNTPDYSDAALALLGHAARFAALAAPALLLVGFVTMANAVLWPVALTLGLAMLLLVLQEFVTDLWVLVTRNRDGSRNELAPVLIGFAVLLLSLPLFAMIWGASVTDLTELWTRIRQGVSMGGIRLSPGAILTFVVVFALGYMATRLLQGTVRNTILPRTRLDEGAKNAAISGLGYVGIVLAGLFAITSAGIDMSSLAIVAGALSVGIGFGLQNIVSNFVSGIILLVERPVAVGDWIQVGDAMGIVRSISVRSTRIQTFDRTDVIVPNSDLISKEVVNWTRGNLQGRIIIPVRVAYGCDTRRVSQILTEIAEDQPTVLINPAPVVLLSGFGTDSLDFELRAVLSDINQGVGVASEIRHQIIERFTREGFEIPFTNRQVRIVSGEGAVFGALAGAGATQGAGTAPAGTVAAGTGAADTTSAGGDSDADSGGADQR